ncbi:MAG: hypothetical protein MUC38_11725 [Cyclobacteriaceae bacterium]|nr:hypothetical protein [Cyclobacteriaceae bacterium]
MMKVGWESSRRLLALVGFAVMSDWAMAQPLAGSFTVGSGGTYATLTAAIAQPAYVCRARGQHWWREYHRPV